MKRGMTLYVLAFTKKRPEPFQIQDAPLILPTRTYPAISKTSNCAVRIRKNMVNGYTVE